MTYLIDLAADLKAKKAGEPVDMFRGKNIALILKDEHAYEMCFEVAGHDLGMG